MTKKLQELIEEYTYMYEDSFAQMWRSQLHKIAQLAEEEGKKEERERMIERFKECLPKGLVITGANYSYGSGYNNCLSQIKENLSNKGIEL